MDRAMNRVPVKPLSVNRAWQGKRFKTQEYKNYEKAVLFMLGPFTVPDGPLKIDLVFGFSNMASDWDNPVKPFQDCLQKKYKFNDSRVMEATVRKVKVSKGNEFIEWGIYATEGN
jgi:Holliday junction resolvase RusA-like endonuclease